MSIVLVGYRGSGKTTIGKRLADRLWQTFVDTDLLVVQKSGRTIAQIFADEGEKGFRDYEARVVAETLKLTEHVISLGGGAVVRGENRSAIRSTGYKVIYLRCEPAELLRRIQSDPQTAQNRPNLLGGGLEEITTHLLDREPLYREVMTAELDVTHLSADEAIQRIARLV